MTTTQERRDIPLSDQLAEIIQQRRNDHDLLVQVAELIDRIDRERKAMEGGR